MLKAVRLACAAGVVALALFSACSSDQSGVPVLVVTANPLQLDGRAGSAAQLTVEAKDGKGAAGIGQVTLTTRAGAFGDGSKQIVLTLANGAANTAFSCVSASDPLCTGQVRIDAAWGTLTYGLTIAVGSGGPDGGNPDGGPVTSGVVSLSASRSPIFFNVGDYSDIRAQISTDAGVSLSDQTISFSTNLGGFVLADGGTSSSFTGTTGATGNTTARFRDTGTAGTAAIVAQHAPSNSTATLSLPILAIQAISWVSTKCGGVDCTIMGIRGSGFHEQATVTFKVVDSSNNPAPGVRVSFFLITPPSGMSVTPSSMTDASGLVSANLSVGPVIGALNVRAVVIPGQVETQSPNIGVRGAKPSNQGFVLDCNPHNVATFATETPPLELSVACKVTLVDRFNNPVGTGTAVNFLSEAGTIPFTVNTVAYPNPDEGTANVPFSTRGAYQLMADTDPLPADASQWPSPRVAEPSLFWSGRTHNPRDGLVTLIAFTRGEEYFDDNNQNGVWDPGERFIDQGEPFVDANDNGIWDPGEDFFDANHNGVYDGPNGTYDSDTTVWTEFRVLYTGRPVADSNHIWVSPSPFTPACPSGVARGATAYLDTHFADFNLNRPQSANVTYNASHIAPKGNVSILGSLLDGYGIGMERLLVDARPGPTFEQACPASVPICKWKVVFYDWGMGQVNPTVIQGAALTDTSACSNDVVTVNATVLGVIYSVQVNGAIQ